MSPAYYKDTTRSKKETITQIPGSNKVFFNPPPSVFNFLAFLMFITASAQKSAMFPGVPQVFDHLQRRWVGSE